MPKWLVRLVFPFRHMSEEDLAWFAKECRLNIWNGVDVKYTSKMLRRVNNEIDHRNADRIKQWEKAGKVAPWWEKKGPFA